MAFPVSVRLLASPERSVDRVSSGATVFDN